jgi:hypothetical protein
VSSGAVVAYNALVATLTTPPLTCGYPIFDNRLSPLERGELPAIVVEMGDEPAPQAEDLTIGFVLRYLDARVTVLVDSATPYSAADDALIETYDAIIADETLGGACEFLTEGDTTRDRDSAGVGAITKTWRIAYRTQRHSLLTGD